MERNEKRKRPSERGAELEREAILAAFDHMPHAVIFLAADRKVLHTNERATEILQKRSGLTLQEGRLVATHNGEAEILRRLLEKGLEDSVSQDGDVMAVTRAHPQRPLSLFVAPLNGRRKGLRSNRALAVVLLGDPDREMKLDLDQLIGLYGFTLSEARLVVELLQGQRLISTAERMGVSLNTARTHLKRVFEKTQTNRQSDLVRFILSSPWTQRATSSAKRPGDFSD